MKEQEAIEKLSWHSSTNGCGQCTDDEHNEAKKIAMQALEKQVPKKVRNPIRRGAYSDCPVCGIELEMPWVYCYKCGQKVDWTVEE